MSAGTVFGVDHSLSGQSWRWRGDLMPGDGLDGHSPDDLLHQLFRARGAQPEDFDRLKTPTLRDWLPDPSCFTDMDAATARIVQAIARQERIVVYGDYDVDGATSAAVLINYLKWAGVPAGYYIPDRLLEGYGPSAEALVALKGRGAELVITVDCGTQGFAALAAARQAGLDVIVVDHHKAATALPEALALINPNRLDETGPAAAHGHLAAVGLAFLLAVSLNRALRSAGHFASRPEPVLTRLLDLVALGTVADVAPLTGLNRAYVAQGLKVMRQRRNIGLAALLDVAGVTRPPLARDLGFALGPRVNAGGRVGAADLGVRLLTTDDPAEAAQIAQELNRLNDDRKAIEAEVTEAALALAHKQEDSPITVVAGAGWHPGVIGIVAARLKERLHRPALVIAIGEDGIAKGSGRSLAGVDLGAAVLAAADHGLLMAGGGHAMAAGVTLDAERISELSSFLAARLLVDVGAATAVRRLSCDAALAPRALDLRLHEALEVAGPYGQGWPAPRLASGPWRAVETRVVGENHLRIILAGADGARIKAIAFRQAETPLGAALSGAGQRFFHVAGRLTRDDWGSQPQAQLEIEDAAFC
ncbi:single-stranded-DNA-specific exonuclease RecJ [Polymorphobacter sp.]|uniref:single-stranded-DNA-specific exonuclease RecJ n=1 Tax=Polymorphobacter sp. TaxID=1909290 RepID=UPI003F704649